MSNPIHRRAVRAWLQLRGRVQDVERGAVMSEYGTLIFFVGITAFGVLILFGEAVLGLFTDTESDFGEARENPAPAD